MSSKLRMDEVKKSFGNEPFTSEQLYNFYLEKELELKKSTFRWRVHKLKMKNAIYSLKRGVYVLESKKSFSPPIDKQLKHLYKKIKTKFPYIKLSIWDTSWLNNYMVHQPLTNNIIVEVDREVMSSVFAFLQESNKNVFLNPNKYEIETYLITGRKNIIVKNLVVESQVKIKDDVSIPKIEKIMVDLFVDDELYIMYQGWELKNIYEAFFKTFSINQSTLNRYVTKRKIKEKFIKFLKEKTDIDKDKIFI